jgi:predicted 3-demethylubiquinone-9 3-methyltransferase (glyoxalase superfamily)
MNKVTPFLWFDSEAEEAAKYYVSVFKKGGRADSKVKGVARYPEGGPMPAGGVMTVEFRLGGQDFTALNAGPHFKFNPAISFVVSCKDQREVDYFWKKLIEGGGEPSQCGWLTDRYGLSWQIVPTRLLQLTTSKDKAKAKRAMAAMMTMQKIDIETIEEAAAGTGTNGTRRRAA